MLMLLRIAFAKKTLKLTALTVAATLAVAPMAGLRQEGKGPRSCATPNRAVLREYTRPILRGRRSGKQNIRCDHQRQPVQRFVADGRRIFVNYGAMMHIGDAEPDHRRAGPRNRPSGRGHLSRCASRSRRRKPDDHRHAVSAPARMVAGARAAAGSGLTNAGAPRFPQPGE